METAILPLRDPSAQARWEELWSVSPQRTPFATVAYAEAACAASGFTCEIALAQHEGKDEAGALVFSRKRGPFREMVVPFYTSFSPLLFRKTPNEAAIHARKTAVDALLPALEERYDVLRLHLHPEMKDVRAIQWCGWKASPLYTYRIPLAGEESLLAGWSSGTRRAFRKARDQFRVAEDAAAATVVVELLGESYARQGHPFPVEKKRLIEWIRTLVSAGTVRIFTATSEETDTQEAAAALLHDGRTAHYWIAGSRPGPAMTVLLGRMLPVLHEAGLTTFDFVGANTPSIAEFKRRFRPTLTPYFRVEKTTHPALRLAYAFRRG